MAEIPYEIKVKCNVCGGDGFTNVEVPLVCPDCNGTGWLFYGRVDGADQIKDLTDKVNDCLDKLNDILEILQNP